MDSIDSWFRYNTTYKINTAVKHSEISNPENLRRFPILTEWRAVVRKN